jgi:hypothetical protein
VLRYSTKAPLLYGNRRFIAAFTSTSAQHQPVLNHHFTINVVFMNMALLTFYLSVIATVPCAKLTIECCKYPTHLLLKVQEPEILLIRCHGNTRVGGKHVEV